MPGSATPAPRHLDLAVPGVLAPLREDLDRVGRRFRQIVSPTPETGDMVRHAARFNGKRLRPALCCVASRLSGAGVTEDVVAVAAIVELIHTATLVHDDILDNAQVRRRVATVNVRWGNHAAVLIGDVLFSRAYNAAAWLDDPFAARFLSEIVGDILEGEIHQDRVSFDPDLTEHEYRRIIHGKTAALYRAAVVVGAHYGGADAALVERLGVFGQHIGTAFQIVDDRLDVTGDESIVGKSLGTDLAEGKMTLPLILWRDGHAPGHRDDARARIRHAWSCEEGALELSRVLREAGALEAADAVARREVDLALAALDDLPASPDRDLLVAIAGYVVDRTR